ncbi:MAG TPA: hypothetical protein VFY73_29130 [Ideonella sp.]|uniref:hypothetical protein n=1 Tax=Ideonella sp. TaxID=1929293 RepID=UPI002E3363F0|nr:hypothetical protein [Ideonella sp.]HEX5688102.1 hypothetical protein [Ideonella sp.]
MRAANPTWPPEGQEEHYRALIAQIGSEIGVSLSSALERVTALATTGKIDRPGLKALRDEIELARRIGMMGQQLARFASGRIRQSPEALSLTQMTRDVLVQRGREISARGIDVRQAMRPIDVIVDATLLHALLQALVDWTMEHAQANLEFRIDLRPWPPHARLSCHFSHRPPAEVNGDAFTHTDGDTPIDQLDTMSWRLVQQIAWALKLGLERVDGPEGIAAVTIEFPQTVTDQMEGVTAIEIDQGFGVSDNSKPLAGAQVLVLAGRRDLRSDIREATRHMGLVVDFVSSVDEAEEFCRDALPQAVIYESALAGQRFDRLRSSIEVDVPHFVFIEIAQEGNTFALSNEGDRQHATLGREAVLASLPSALIFELSRTL